MLDEEGDALQVGGVLGLRRLAFGDVQMHAQAQRFGFVRNNLARLEVDLDLDVTGQVTRPTIAGTAVIEQGRVEVDRVLASLDRNRTPIGPDDGVPVVGTAATRTRRRRPPVPVAAPTPVTVTHGRGGERRPAEAARRASTRGATAASRRTPWSCDGARHPRADSRRTCCCAARTSAAIRPRPASATSRSSSAATSASRRSAGGRPRWSARSRPFAAATSTTAGASRSCATAASSSRAAREIDPALDVTARRIIEPSGVEARIRVQGTARDPTLSFSSTPPLDESDILALIIFNRDLNNLGASEKGDCRDDGRDAPPPAWWSRRSPTQLGRKLGLEEIDVQTTNDASGPGGVVTVGDRFGERLFVRLRQQFGAQEVSELLLEYRLSELLRLQGSVAEGDGVGRANRSLTRRVERGGSDLVFYYRY